MFLLGKLRRTASCCVDATYHEQRIINYDSLDVIRFEATIFPNEGEKGGYGLKGLTPIQPFFKKTD